MVYLPLLCCNCLSLAVAVYNLPTMDKAGVLQPNREELGLHLGSIHVHKFNLQCNIILQISDVIVVKPELSPHWEVQCQAVLLSHNINLKFSRTISNPCD